MPPADEIQTYLSGVWQMMMGKPDGLKMLDISADGFWNSFFAIVVALPALLVGWAGFANMIAETPDMAARLGVLSRLFLSDIATWVLPYAVLAIAARPLEVSNRFVHYVVASNWASALFAWIMLPPALIRLLAPALNEVANGLGLLIFLVTLVLSFRLTVVVIGKGAPRGAAVFFSMLLISVVVLMVMQSITGLGQLF